MKLLLSLRACQTIPVKELVWRRPDQEASGKRKGECTQSCRPARPRSGGGLLDGLEVLRREHEEVREISPAVGRVSYTSVLSLLR